MIAAARPQRSIGLAWGLCCVAALLLGGPAAAGDTVERPRFSFLRQDEDWSVLAQVEPEQRTGRFDAIKYIPLTADGSVWLSLGGTLRARHERWRNFAFGAPDEDTDAFLLGRLLAHADLHFGRRSRVFVELKSAESTRRDLPGGRRPLDVDSFDLQQGFVDVDLGAEARGKVVLRLGRQALSIGRQRLVSPLPWGNSLRSWDGLTMMLQPAGWNVEVFWTQFAPVDRYGFNEPDPDRRFSGVVAGHEGRRIDYEMYALWLDRDQSIAFNGTAGSESRYTVGGRGWCAFRRGRIDVEIARQFGSIGDGDIEAEMAALEMELELASIRWMVGLDYASGDRRRGGDVQTFNQLFPLGHAYLGYLDVVGRQNVIDASGGVSFGPLERLRARVSVHRLRRAETTDAVYGPGGGIVVPASAGSSREIGTEVDVVLRRAVSPHTSIELGLGRLFAGDLPRQAGSGDDIDFGYLQFEYRF